MLTASLRPLRESDLDAARALLRDAVPVATHLVPLLSAVEAAAIAPGTEQRGLVADAAGELAATAIYGEYAGAAGAGRLHLVVVREHHRRRGLGALLLKRIVADLQARSARFILTELPDERPALADYFAFLHASGFVEESRVPDFYREGVGLVLMRRE
ncbi:MAG TPA: GNAT family N-acetyltransferase [Gemmatimonadaceae bacterium]|jgi:GNAT superfamily N-acetyltransferase|nr:GNAT family N-acetyltransferase [Gemmatimonadaceae bacterium]